MWAFRGANVFIDMDVSSDDALLSPSIDAANVSDNFCTTMHDYISTCSQKVNHSELLHGVHYICEIFGFPVSISKSEYTTGAAVNSIPREPHVRRVKGQLREEVLRRALFVCPSSSSTGCKLRFTLYGSRSSPTCHISRSWGLIGRSAMQEILQYTERAFRQKLPPKHRTCPLKSCSTLRE